MATIATIKYKIMNKKLALNGNSLNSGDPSLKLDFPWTAHPSIQITTTSQGDLKWVFLTLPVNVGSKIDSVTIYYQNSSTSSFISQIRLTNQTTPDFATVVHDDGTDLHSTSPTSFTSSVSGVVVEGSIILELRLFFASTSDMIKIGAIVIGYR
jgi:hypothetical protein